jgi:hypothetical protein
MKTLSKILSILSAFCLSYFLTYFLILLSRVDSFLTVGVLGIVLVFITLLVEIID